MDALFTYFKNFQTDSFWITALVLLLGTFLLSIFGRFVFGKRSALNHAISSAIGILFIYAATVVLYGAGAQYESLIAPLPFIRISGDQILLFSFTGTHYTVICQEVLSMVILAFLVNLVDGWLPKGKNIFIWLIFRCLTVALAYILHLIMDYLIVMFLPEGIMMYAPMILLGLLVLLLLTGALKVLVGALLTTVNPIIGGLYTFFFATVIGKQISKAVLTTVILSAAVFGLQYAGISAFSIASAALAAYIPFLIILIILWYLVFKVF